MGDRFFLQQVTSILAVSPTPLEVASTHLSAPALPKEDERVRAAWEFRSGSPSSAAPFSPRGKLCGPRPWRIDEGVTTDRESRAMRGILCGRSEIVHALAENGTEAEASCPKVGVRPKRVLPAL